MKNIHVLPTDKPSRLGYLTKKGKEVFKDLRLFDKPMPNILDSENQHIYITSDEEIKIGNWCIDKHNAVYKQETDKIFTEFTNSKKIILTTDPDLITDSVQAIDDEFLEWFVKNPSCEDVEVKSLLSNNGRVFYGYKTIIPQEDAILAKWDRLNKELDDALESEFGSEEPKQETRVFGTKDDKSFWGDKPKQDPTLENSKLALREYILANKEKVTEDLQEMREKSGTGRDETLEEAALSFLPRSEVEHDTDFITGFEFGAEWQAKRKYSEEDMLDFAEYCLKNVDAFSTLKDLFEQFKKK